MKTAQRGIGFIGTLFMLVGIVLVAILGMKVVPAYIEYFNIKKAITALVESGELRGATVGDVRAAFQRRADIDDFTSVTARDLDISKDGDSIVLAFAYEKRVPLFANLSLVIDFEGSSNPNAKASRLE